MNGGTSNPQERSFQPRRVPGGGQGVLFCSALIARDIAFFRDVL